MGLSLVHCSYLSIGSLQLLVYGFFLLSNASSKFLYYSQAEYNFLFLHTFFIIPFVPIYFLSMPLFFVAEVWWEWKLGEAEPDHHTI